MDRERQDKLVQKLIEKEQKIQKIQSWKSNEKSKKKDKHYSIFEKTLRQKKAKEEIQKP